MAGNRWNELLGRTYLVFAGILLVAMAILGRVVHTQVFQGDKWRSMADSLYVRTVAVEAEMGNILSEDGAILATSTVLYELRMDMKSSAMADADFQANVDSLGYYLSTVIDGSLSPGAWAARLRKARANGERYHLIARRVHQNQLNQVKQFPLFRLGKYKGGLIVLDHQVRSRPFGDLARRTIGHSRTGQGSYGLEGKYLNEIQGEKGFRLMQHLPGNVRIPVHDLSEIAPKPGNDLLTTLDMGMQDMAHHALTRALQDHEAESGVAVVMEVKTGKIRAMVNLDRNGDRFTEQYNHAIGSAVEPGSVFKLASAMVLLEDGHVEADDKVDLEKGRVAFFDRVMEDAHPHGLDTVTFQEAFEMSSNVGIAKLVQRYYGAQPQAFVERLSRLGLSSPVGIDLEGEAEPMIKHPSMGRRMWSGVTLPWMSMGYEMKVTPIQLLALYAAVANDGRMMRPMLVTEVQRNGQPVRQFHPRVLSRRIASRSTIRTVQEMLEGVVERGTARNGRTSHYRFAGKTGTARIQDKKTEHVTYRSSFVGYFPVEDPLYACIVMINGAARQGYYGSEVALPVFRRIADYCFSSRMEMFPEWEGKALAGKQGLTVPGWEAGYREDFRKLCRESDVRCEHASDSDWTVTQAGPEETLVLNNRFCPEGQVPNVVGMGLRDALYVLENAGLKVDPFGIGKVRRQTVAAGTHARGQYVRIYLE